MYDIIYADPPWRYDFSKDNADNVYNCGATSSFSRNPDYCSDDSPRRLLTVPIIIVIGRVGRLEFAKHVLAIAHPDCEFENGLMQLLMEVEALDLATACVEAHKESK